MRYLLAAILWLGFIVNAGAQSTIFIVRHAEKAEAGGHDPELSPAGRTRAETLARMLKDLEIKAIYVTQLKRTQQTAAPLSRVLGLEPEMVPAAETAALVAKLRLNTGNVLVVGHAHTIPSLLKRLGVAAPTRIRAAEYDNFFVVVRDPQPQLIRLHY